MRASLMMGACLALLGLAACGSDKDEEGLRTGRLTLREGRSVGDAPECGVDLPQCAEGLSCFSFKLDGTHQTRCVDESTVCQELLSCTGGTECAILLSYPAQVTCSGTCTGPDCDDSVSHSP